ncbi:MAG TPA: hypothetical protein VLC91_11565 [Spongiibacteraceae bacterium]|nr:hypothetical protein [Spongiibacteraceae bacterium]
MSKPNNLADEDTAASMNNHNNKTVANPSPGSSDPSNESTEKRRSNNPAMEKEASR